MNPNVKEVAEEDPQAVCQFCHRSEVNCLEWGPIYQLDGVTSHYFCLLFSAALNQNGEDVQGILGFLPGDILKEVKRGAKLRCRFCRKPNATIGCWKSTCQMSYHYPCGLSKGCSFHFIGDYESYCSNHKEKVEIPFNREREEVPEHCLICYDDVTKDGEPLWPTCCRKEVLFHKKCIMKMGKTTGLHFFKCPLCNDKETFSDSMRKAGVYLPDRDADWETEPNAFAEHSQRYERCDAGECHCPQGRDHSDPSKTEMKPWKIIRCGGCGASAIHMHCGNLQNLSWRCPTCAEILLGKKAAGDAGNSRIQRFHQEPSSSTLSNGEVVFEVGEKNPIKTEPLDDWEALSPEEEECSPVPSCSFSSEPEGSRVQKIFDPRYGRGFAVDDEESSGSTEEEEVDAVVLISPPASRVHPPQEMEATITSLPKSSDPPIPVQDDSSAPPDPSPPVSESELLSKTEGNKSKKAIAKTDKDKTLTSSPDPEASNSDYGDQSSISHLPKDQGMGVLTVTTDISETPQQPVVNLVEDDISNRVDSEGQIVDEEAPVENLSDEEGICILNCFSLAVPPASGSTDETRKKTDEDGTNKGSSLDRSILNSDPNLGRSPSSSSDDDVNVGTGAASNQPISNLDENDDDSDLEVVCVNTAPAPLPSSKKPAIMSLIQKHRDGHKPTPTPLPVMGSREDNHPNNRQTDSIHITSSPAPNWIQQLLLGHNHNHTSEGGRAAVSNGHQKPAPEIIDLDSDSEDENDDSKSPITDAKKPKRSS